MLGLRNMYRVFQESRGAARRQATVAVVGTGPEAEMLASLLDAQRNTAGAEIILTVSGGGRVSLSGEAVEEAAELTIPSSLSEDAVREDMAYRIVDALDEDYLIPLGRGYPLFRRAVCAELVQASARQNAVIGALPIPGADMPVITANQGRMVLGLAAAHGEALTLERARELASVLAAGFGLRALARQVVKLIPLGGWAASAAIAYAGTLAMGRAAILYFERGKQELESGELAEIRRRAVQEAQAFVSRMRRRRDRK